MVNGNARRIAENLMEEHMPGLVDAGWRFQWDNAKRRAGCCDYRKKTIQISRHHSRLNDEVEVRDTILHEIAHAIIGPGHGHNHQWKAAARLIGAKPVRCHNAATPDGKYQATCTSCLTVHHRHQLTGSMRNESLTCNCQKIVASRRAEPLVWKAAATGRRVSERMTGIDRTSKWHGTCDCAGKVFRRNRLSQRSRAGRCPRCKAGVSWRQMR